MGKQQYMNTRLEIAVNNITPIWMKNIETFYYVNKQKISTIEVGTTQIIKASKHPKNKYVKYEMMPHSRIRINKCSAIIDGTLLLEM